MQTTTKKQESMLKSDEIIIADFTYPFINLHFTGACNYHCQYCFVDKHKKKLPLADIMRVIDNIADYYQTKGIRNGRITLVGGEPLVDDDLLSLIHYIHGKGIDIYIVTNGSLITGKFLGEVKGKVSCIGISVDSLDEQTNRKIGRCDCRGNVIPREHLDVLCGMVRGAGIKLKINICVSKFNVLEDFSDFLAAVRPERLKIFQMAVIDNINPDSRKNQITKAEFNKFIKKHRSFNPVAETEKQMQSGYLKIDSEGKLVSTDTGSETIVGSLLEEPFGELLKRCPIDHRTYSARYEKNDEGGDDHGSHGSR